jgi:hypothetical protein
VKSKVHAQASADGAADGGAADVNDQRPDGTPDSPR